MEVQEWLGEDNQLGIDIFNKKYRFENESLDQFFTRVSGGNEKIKQLMIDKKFLPAGRILANRGLDKLGKKITLSNCYVIDSPEDNIESLFDTASKLARTYSYGGGVGLDISKLSPRGSKINNAAKETTGAVSFMELYSMVTGLIGQSGRRGALMISLDCTHPDLEEFIELKNDLTKVTKANISIKITDDFMNAVVKNKPFKLSFTRETTGEVIEKVIDAKSLFTKIAKMNWEMAEPGFLFWTQIESWNLLSNDENFMYTSVNPCAEEPLPAWGSCLLSSINLSSYVINPFTKESKFDYDSFNNDIKEITIFMNEILDEGLSLHPLQEQRDCVANWRQIGIGFMGLGDMLIQMGIKYGSSDSITLCDMVGFNMINSAIYQSALLAKEQGSYPSYNEEAILSSPFFNANTSEETKETVNLYGLRNSQISTCAPTGSISNMLGITGGIEPIYNISYTRKTESLHDSDTYYKVYTPIVKQFMEVNNITDDKDLPDYFVTAMTLNYKDRIEMQATWQYHIDASISSTVNVPENFTVEEVEQLYLYAWQKGLKGVTIYRDNCKRSGILTNTTPTPTVETKELEFIPDSIFPISRSSLGKTYGVTVDKKTACGKMFVTINRDKSGNIVESFVNVGKQGVCKSNVDGLNRLISLALRSGIKVEEISDQLKGISCASCSRAKSKGEKIDGLSCPDIIGRLLEEEYKDNVIIKEVKPRAKKVKETIKTVETVTENGCPECGKPLSSTGGCFCCEGCGYSKCE